MGFGVGGMEVAVGVGVGEKVAVGVSVGIDVDVELGSEVSVNVGEGSADASTSARQPERANIRMRKIVFHRRLCLNFIRSIIASMVATKKEKRDFARFPLEFTRIDFRL